MGRRQAAGARLQADGNGNRAPPALGVLAGSSGRTRYRLPERAPGEFPEFTCPRHPARPKASVLMGGAWRPHGWPRPDLLPPHRDGCSQIFACQVG